MTARHGLMILTLLLTAPPALGHAFLERAFQGAGASVAVAPAGIRLSFSSAVDPRLSKVVLRDATGAQVDDGVLQAMGRDIIVGVAPLPPGLYVVEWRVSSTDRRKPHGRFQFTIGP